MKSGSVNPPSLFFSKSFPLVYMTYFYALKNKGFFQSILNLNRTYKIYSTEEVSHIIDIIKLNTLFNYHSISISLNIFLDLT